DDDRQLLTELKEAKQVPQVPTAAPAPASIKLKAGSVKKEHLAFIPLAAQLPGTSLAFGSQSYEFESGVKSLKIRINFAEPFVNLGYVLLSMSDHPSCYCYVSDKQNDYAELEIVRTKLTHDPRGYVQWIAVGAKATK